MQGAADRLVWYAGYGSNLSRARFESYIRGGTPEGSARPCSGCRDGTLPRRDLPITLGHRLFFAESVQRWGGAVAFIEATPGASTTLGRMYLISYEQLNDVVLQENGRDATGTSILPTLERITTEQRLVLPGIRLYGRLLYIGSRDSSPIITFTATRHDFTIGPPSEAYVRMIVRGLRETYPLMGDEQIAEYLGSTDGIRDRLDPATLTAWVMSVQQPD